MPICIKVFLGQLPCLRRVAKCCDLESAAYVACCKAARTYDPDRGVGLSAYFSVAIRNAMLREVQKELRTNAHSVQRISLEEIQRRQPLECQPAEEAFAALLQLTDEQRDWIESFVFDGTSFRAFGRRAKCDPRTAKKRIKSHLSSLRKQVEDQP